MVCFHFDVGTTENEGSVTEETAAGNGQFDIQICSLPKGSSYFKMNWAFMNPRGKKNKVGQVKTR